MNARINVTLKKLPGKRKKAIQLSLAAGFRVVDCITGDIGYRYLKLLIGESILESNWDKDSQRPHGRFILKRQVQAASSHWTKSRTIRKGISQSSR